MIFVIGPVVIITMFRFVFVDSTWKVGPYIDGSSLHGCLQSVIINNQSYYITESTDKQGVVAGCTA